MTSRDQIARTNQIANHLPVFLDISPANWTDDSVTLKIEDVTVTDIGWTVDGVTTYRDGRVSRITVIGTYQEEDPNGLFDACTELTANQDGATFATGSFEHDYRAATLHGFGIKRSAGTRGLPEHVTDPLAQEILASLIAAVQVRANL